jgi:hypothetical protein
MTCGRVVAYPQHSWYSMFKGGRSECFSYPDLSRTANDKMLELAIARRQAD